GENRRRLELLRRARHFILDPLPTVREYSWIEIDESDVPDLYIIPVYDWYLDSGRTFRLVDVPNNLQAGRGTTIGGGPHPIDHLGEVDRKISHLRAYGWETEVLIVVSTDGAAPHTIIDGTHRSAALLQMHLEGDRTFPWQAIQISSPDMR